MSSNPLPASANSANLYDDSVGGTLRALVERYGVTLLGESGRLRGLLQDECPQAKREISVILQALEERVPQDLLRVHSGEPIGSLSPRLVKRLSDEKSMSPQACRWAVATWAQGLGMDAAIGVYPDFVATEKTQNQQPILPSAANEEFQQRHETPPPPSRRIPPWTLVVGAVALLVGCWAAFFQPKLEIVGVEMQGTFVGDGKAHPVSVNFNARNSAVHAVEVRYVRGDGEWNAQPSTYEVAAGSSGPTQAAAGTLGYTTTKPMSTTFSYVLIASDGRRSTPYEHTFAIVPPLVITEVAVPKSLKVGQSFSVTLKYQRSASDVVRVERHVVNSSVPWNQNDSVQVLATPDASGAVLYSFDASPKALRSTVEFVLVDAQGVRSEPKRVALNVGVTESGSGPGTVLSIQEFKTPGQETGMGAVIGGVLGGLLGNRFGHGNGKAATTILGAGGGAYAGHQVEGSLRSAAVWHVTVRLDEGTVRTLNQSSEPRFRVGDRVVVANGSVN